jgi:tetrahydromethanopterin S-methyltransferase subunit F
VQLRANRCYRWWQSLFFPAGQKSSRSQRMRNECHMRDIKRAVPSVRSSYSLISAKFRGVSGGSSQRINSIIISRAQATHEPGVNGDFGRLVWLVLNKN